MYEMVDDIFNIKQNKNNFEIKMNSDMKLGLKLLNIKRNEAVIKIKKYLNSLKLIKEINFSIEYSCGNPQQEWIFGIILNCEPNINSNDFIKLQDKVYKIIYEWIQKQNDCIRHVYFYSFIICGKPLKN